MKTSLKTAMVAAAVSGLLSGATVMHAAVTSPNGATPILKAGKTSLTTSTMYKAAKHSCKGKNDCKGQGGCKSSDNGCKGKNSCKGKGGCATDGSKMPG
ncbi:MAG: hypothetical protein WA414_04440 [Acidobacteriaceae bacterium]|jgi:hypothetical protein